MPLSRSGQIQRFLLRAFLIAYACWAVAWIVADVAHFRAKAWTEAWANLAAIAQQNGDAPFRPGQDDWQEAETEGSLAAGLSPLSPDYQETLARIYELRDSDLPAGDPQARPARLQALSLYRQAAALRPTWPYGPIEIALAKYRLGELDADYDAALRQAARLGPWEDDIMVATAQMGMENWAGMSPAARQSFLDAVVRSQSWNPTLMEAGADRVWAVAKANHKDLWICGLLPRQQRTPYYAGYCQPRAIVVAPPEGSEGAELPMEAAPALSDQAPQSPAQQATPTQSPPQRRLLNGD